MFDSTTVVSVRIQRPSSTLRARACKTMALFTVSHVSALSEPMLDCSADFIGVVADGDRRQNPRSWFESPRWNESSE